LKKSNKNLAASAIILVTILAILVGAQFLHLQLLSWISPGWEIYNQVGAMRHRSENYVSTSDFTYPRDLMGTYWKVDIDEETWGVPTIMCELGDVHHVDWTGRDVPWDQPADYRETVLPADVRTRVAVEAGIKLGWEHYVGLEGIVLRYSP